MMNMGMIPTMWMAWSTNFPSVLVPLSVRGRRA